MLYGVEHMALTLISTVIALCALYLGVPAYRMARSQVQTQRHAEEAAKAAKEQAEFQRRVLQAIAGNDDEAGSSPESPSLRDLMSDTRDALRYVNRLQVIMARHVSDGHGEPIPHELWPD